MASYKIGTFPQSEYSFRLFDNPKKLSWQQIKKQTGCYALINLGYFEMSTYKNCTTTMMTGQWLYKANWSNYGILIDSQGRLTIGTDKEAVYDYMEGCPPVYVNGTKVSNQTVAKNGATYLGVKANGDVVLFLCSKDSGMTSAQCETVMKGQNCSSIIRWDGSWSSQGSLGAYGDVDPSQERKVRTYLLVYKRNSGSTTPTPSTSTSTSTSSKGDTTMASYTTSAVNKVYKCTYTKSDGLNVRSTPDTSSSKNILGQIYKDSYYYITMKSSNGWLYIRDYGWVSSSYMTETNCPLVNNKQYRCTSNGLNVRYTPSSASSKTIVGSLTANSVHTVSAMTADGKWYLIENGGWVSASFMTLVLDTSTTTTTSDTTPVEQPDSWAEQAWKKATDQKIFDGTAPKREITQQELAVVLERCGLLK